VGAGQPLAVAEQREIAVGHAYARVYGERTVWNRNAAILAGTPLM
jgi:hypothetical protein